MFTTEYYFANLSNQIMNATTLALIAILAVIFLLMIAAAYSRKKPGNVNPLIIIVLACLAVGVYGIIF